MIFAAVIILIALVFFIQNTLYEKLGFSQLEYRCYFNTEQALEGDDIEIIEEVTNGKWLPLAWFKAEITTSRWLEFAGAQSVVADQSRFVPSFFMLKSYHKIVRSWHVKCLKRGEYFIDSVTLVSTDLLGFVTLSRRGNSDGRLLVLPRPLEMDTFVLKPRYFTGDIPVNRHHIEDPFEISGVREYTGFESIRDIHWAATAKENRLMVYKKDSTSKQNLAVILNVQSREGEYEHCIDRHLVEVCIKVAAGILEQTIACGIPVRLLCNTSSYHKKQTTVTDEHWGRSHVENLFHLLALLPLDLTEKFSVFLENIPNEMTATDIIILTCYIDDNISDFARRRIYSGSNVTIASLSQSPKHVKVDESIVLPLLHLRDTFLEQVSS